MRLYSGALKFLLVLFLQVCESYSVTSVMLWAVRVQVNTLWFLVWITYEHF